MSSVPPSSRNEARTDDRNCLPEQYRKGKSYATVTYSSQHSIKAVWSPNLPARRLSRSSTAHIEEPPSKWLDEQREDRCGSTHLHSASEDWRGPHRHNSVLSNGGPRSFALGVTHLVGPSNDNEFKIKVVGDRTFQHRNDHSSRLCPDKYTNSGQYEVTGGVSYSHGTPRIFGGHPEPSVAAPMFGDIDHGLLSGLGSDGRSSDGSNSDLQVQCLSDESIQLPSASPLRPEDEWDIQRLPPSYGGIDLPAHPTRGMNLRNPVPYKESIYRFLQQRFVCLGPREGKGAASSKEADSSRRPSNRESHGGALFPPPNEKTRQSDISVKETNTPHPAEKDFLRGDSFFEDGYFTPAGGFRTPAPHPGFVSQCVTSAGYLTPQVHGDLVMFTLSNFEALRNAFNRAHSAEVYNQLAEERHVDVSVIFEELSTVRNKEMLRLAELLADVSRTSFTEPADRACNLAYSNEGLNVWKKEFGIGRILVRAEFCAAVTPLEYCRYASDPNKRKEWDHNVEQVRKIEALAPGCHVSYLAVKRVATVFPRDTVNLKMMKKLQSYTCDTSPQKYGVDLSTETEASATYTSCSCSIAHPLEPEREDHVRMDLRIGSYVAEPFPTPFGIWTRVYSFNEGDPKGWIPSAVVRMLSAKVIPKSVERLVSGLMRHHEVDLKGQSAVGYVHRRLADVDPMELEKASTNFFSPPPVVENAASNLVDSIEATDAPDPGVDAAQEATTHDEPQGPGSDVSQTHSMSRTDHTLSNIVGQ